MTKVGKQAGGGRNRACGKAGRRGRWRRHLLTGKVKRDAAPGCELPDGAPQNKKLKLICFYFIQLQLSINILL